MEPTNLPSQSEFVWRRLEEPFWFFGKEYDGRWWLVVLLAVLAVGLVYVVWMYKRDSRTVGWAFASFLGALRCTVYCVLAIMFLLPARQYIDQTTQRFKIILMFDVSGSMSNKDEPPTEVVKIDQILNRQDKIVRFLSDEQIAFVKKLQRHPVTMYRFGGKLDTEFRPLDENEKLAKEDWNAFLKPDPKQAIPDDVTDEDARKQFRERLDLYAVLINGTNVAESVLEVLKRESNVQPQGIVVFSDGRSTALSMPTVDEVKRSKIPIFTVGVGEHREPVNIRITDLLVPEHAQPDDKFPLKVEIDGEGKPDEEVAVEVDIYKPSDEKTPAHTLKSKARFKRGEPPHAQVEFHMDPASPELPKSLLKEETPGKPELLEGKWKFRVRIPKDKREVFEGKEHVSEPEFVNIVKRPMRVLLFAGAPTRDYQFARTLLVREVDNQRAELSIFLQLARAEIVQDVKPERLLREFPGRIDDTKNPDEKIEEKYYNLAQYDVIVAFDPDWTKLSPEQLALLQQWVGRHNGGLIMVGGPVNTFQLARPGMFQERIKPVLEMCPVIPEDNRIQGIERSTSDPWRLNFPGANREMEFLKLDDESQEPLAGWEEFFTGKKEKEPGRDTGLRRGFFDYYPVKDVKPSATVVATFTDPRARMRDTKPWGLEHPYLVTMPYQGGKVVWIGSGEIWRLRQFREAFHERFWTKLIRYAGSASQSGGKSHGQIYIRRTYSTNEIIRFETRLLGRGLKPLPPRTRVQALLMAPGATEPRKIDLDPKMSPDEYDKLTAEQKEQMWEGFFAGRFQVDAPGTYEIIVPIPETTEKPSKKIVITESNPEMDNPRPDFAQLRQFASLAGLLDTREIPKDVRERLDSELERGNPAAKKEERRLFFDLRSADLIPECMTVKDRTQDNNGPVRDLWDWGFSFGEDPPLKVSIALLVIIGFLSIEWLTRKLLKLA